jgi:hypothetical protein
MATSGNDQAEARARVEAVLESLRRVDLQVVIVLPPDSSRLAARERARAMAAGAGRADLFESASAAAREATLRAFARGGFSGTWVATEMAVSVTKAQDRVAAAAAFEGAAMAAVVEDLADDDTLDVLRATSNELDRSTGIPPPGSLATLGAGSGVAARGPVGVAALVALVVLSAVAWATFGPGVGLVVFALGAAAIASLERRRSSPET